MEAFIEGTLKTIASNGNLADFVSHGLANIVGVKATVATDIAVKDAKNPAAVNAAIAGGVEGLTTAAGIEAVVFTAAKNSKLSKVVSDVVAAGTAALNLPPRMRSMLPTYAHDATANIDNPKLNGPILSGVLRAAGLPSATPGQTTAEIVTNVYGATLTSSNAASVAAAGAVGTGATDGTGNSRAAELASILAATAAGNSTVQTQDRISGDQGDWREHPRWGHEGGAEYRGC